MQTKKKEISCPNAPPGDPKAITHTNADSRRKEFGHRMSSSGKMQGMGFTNVICEKSLRCSSSLVARLRITGILQTTALRRTTGKKQKSCPPAPCKMRCAPLHITSLAPFTLRAGVAEVVAGRHFAFWIATSLGPVQYKCPRFDAKAAHHGIV